MDRRLARGQPEAVSPAHDGVRADGTPPRPEAGGAGLTARTRPEPLNPVLGRTGTNGSVAPGCRTICFEFLPRRLLDGPPRIAKRENQLSASPSMASPSATVRVPPTWSSQFRKKPYSPMNATGQMRDWGASFTCRRACSMLEGLSQGLNSGLVLDRRTPCSISWPNGPPIEPAAFAAEHDPTDWRAGHGCGSRNAAGQPRVSPVSLDSDSDRSWLGWCTRDRGGRDWRNR